MKVETNKRCPLCQRGMKPLFGGTAYKCKCGNAYVVGGGFVRLQPGEDIYMQQCQVYDRTLFYPRIGVEATEQTETVEDQNSFIPMEVTSEYGPFQRDAYHIVKGGLYYVRFPMTGDGHEIYKSRPCIVVSNVQQMEYTSTVTVIPCTTGSQENMKCHVKIVSGGRAAVAKVEQITTVDTRRVGSFMGMASVEEMMALKKTMQQYLGYIEKVPDEQVANANLQADNYALRAQLQEAMNEIKRLRRVKTGQEVTRNGSALEPD